MLRQPGCDHYQICSVTFLSFPVSQALNHLGMKAEYNSPPSKCHRVPEGDMLRTLLAKYIMQPSRLAYSFSWLTKSSQESLSNFVWALLEELKPPVQVRSMNSVWWPHWGVPWVLLLC